MALSSSRSPRDYRRNNDPFAAIRRNNRIKAPQIRVISPEGNQLGILDTPKALQLAVQFNLDLVEVAPNAVPPVCRIMDFGKYVYEEQKKLRTANRRPARLRKSNLLFASNSTTSSPKLNMPRSSSITATRLSFV